MTVTDWEELILSILPTSISEDGGQAVARVTRTNFDNSLPLVVSIGISDTSELASESTVTIPRAGPSPV